MSSVIIRDMENYDEYFIGTCSHVNESEEIDRCGEKRRAWLAKMHGEGLRVKAALINGNHVGFLYVMPIEICPWGPRGKDLMVIPCLYVLNRFVGKKVGSVLLDEAGKETRRQGKKGLARPLSHDTRRLPSGRLEQVLQRAAPRNRNVRAGLYAGSWPG